MTTIKTTTESMKEDLSASSKRSTFLLFSGMAKRPLMILAIFSTISIILPVVPWKILRIFAGRFCSSEGDPALSAV